MSKGPTGQPLRRIRIERSLPAPLMDGFDVRALRAGHTYEVDQRMASYLIVAGYAVAIESDDGRRRKRRP